MKKKWSEKLQFGLPEWKSDKMTLSTRWYCYIYHLHNILYDVTILGWNFIHAEYVECGMRIKRKKYIIRKNYNTRCCGGVAVCTFGDRHVNDSIRFTAACHSQCRCVVLSDPYIRWGYAAAAVMRITLFLRHCVKFACYIPKNALNTEWYIEE